jgi:competence protein ComEC
MKLFFILLISFSLIIIWTSLERFSARAEVVFFDVGQGDSFILKTPTGKLILVDGGPDWSTLFGLGQYLPWQKRTIDLLILSHSHEDHLSSLPEIARRYQIKHVFLPASLHGAAAEELLLVLENQGSTIIYPQEPACLDLEADCRLCIFPPSSEFLSSSDENDFSLAVNFICDGLSLAATGDAGVKREQSLLASGFIQAVQILKAAHHGSISANSLEFLRALAPEVMVFSVGENNPYDHPSPEVINRAGAEGIEIRCTDQDGELLFYSNNSELYLKDN